MRRATFALLGLLCVSLAVLIVVHVSQDHRVTLAEKAAPPAAAAAAGGVNPPPVAAATAEAVAAVSSGHATPDQRRIVQSAFERGIPKEMRTMINTAVDPCDNFHQWACGTFEKTAEIPPERTSWSYSWDGDGAEILGKLHKILIHDQTKPGFYYRACMDTRKIEQLGTKPLQPWLTMTSAVKTKVDVAAAVAKLQLAEVPVLFEWFVGTDDKNAERTMLYLDAGGLTLPDATYYVEEERFNQHKEPFLAYVEKALTLSGIPAAEAKVMALTTLTIETELASHTQEWEEGDTYKYNVSSLAAMIPQFDWAKYFDTIGHSDLAGERIVLTNPHWFRSVGSILSRYTVTDIQYYLTAHLVMNVSPLLTEPFLDNNLQLDRSLYGIAARTPRWKKCTRATRHALPFMVSKLFVERYFPPSAKKLALDMMETIRDAFKEDLATLSWMTNSTKVAALGKLNRIFFEVGYPADWPVYGFLTMLDAYFDNAMRASEWRSLMQLERLRHPVQRRAWDVTPVNVNAFYYNGVNGVFLPTGILQPPFFDWKQPLAHNYGSIGAIMGHELTHGFDGTGAQFNAQGLRVDWWDDQTLDEFDTRKQCVRDYYSQFELYGQHVSGANTLDEDIADIGGLKMAYRAYLIAEKRKNHVPNVMERRMFWTAFAQTWCGVMRKETQLVNMLTDEHAPDKFRITGAISQNPDFARDFQCPPNSKMNPATRCELW